MYIMADENTPIGTTTQLEDENVVLDQVQPDATQLDGWEWSNDNLPPSDGNDTESEEADQWEQPIESEAELPNDEGGASWEGDEPNVGASQEPATESEQLSDDVIPSETEEASEEISDEWELQKEEGAAEQEGAEDGESSVDTKPQPTVVTTTTEIGNPARIETHYTPPVKETPTRKSSPIQYGRRGETRIPHDEANKTA